MTPDNEKEAFEWMRSRPDAVKDLMRKFPPCCTVRYTGHLCGDHEDAGREFTVVSYFEDGHIGLDGGAMALPEECEVVDFDGGMDHEWVKNVLGDEE